MGEPLSGHENPPFPGTRPEPLETNVTYRLLVRAGSYKGQCDFQLGGRPPPAPRTPDRWIRRLHAGPGYVPIQSFSPPGGRPQSDSGNFAKGRDLRPATFLGNRTTRMKRTAARRVNRRWHVARQNDALPFCLRVHFRDGRNQRLRVRVLRVADDGFGIRRFPPFCPDTSPSRGG